MSNKTQNVQAVQAAETTVEIFKPFGVLENETFGFERISNLQTNGETFTSNDGTEFSLISGTFTGMRKIQKPSLLTKKDSGEKFAVLQSKEVGIVSIEGNEYKLSSSNTSLKVGEVYQFQLRTSAKVEKENSETKEKFTDFALTTKNGAPVKWLVMDNSLLELTKPVELPTTA